MNEAQKAAAEAWVNEWSSKLLAEASVFTRGAYKGFLDQHKEEVIAGIGAAVLSVPGDAA